MSPFAPDLPGPDRSTADADVLAAGTVLWRPGPLVALVHRPKYDDWSLPKGKLDEGESLSAAAVRETREETGLRSRLGALLGDVRYDVPEGRKLVRYWAAECLDPPEFAENDEVDALRWLAPADAAALLTHDHDKAVVALFAAQGPPRSVLLLVRHAKAGSRNNWDGDDDLRPLSEPGRVQVSQLVPFLARFGPERAATAPPVRCRDTIAPLVADLGLPAPSEEPLLGENGYWETPEAGLARLRELAAQPGVTVLSSQGGVIPDVVGALLGEGDLALGELAPDTVVPSRKASTWVLCLGPGGELRSADYYGTPTTT
ncbi:MAG: NUDIX hydrolase [Pseudonocardia sp.]|nr:NUDIX hydrolase [Pseudonocardia sp.]